MKFKVDKLCGKCRKYWTTCETYRKKKWRLKIKEVGKQVSGNVPVKIK